MAGDVIDTLSIELNSNSTKANAAVDKLITKLGSLQTSLASVNGSGGHLVGLGKGVQSLGTGMQSLNGIGEKKFERLANGINRLTAIDTSGLNKSASALRQITNAFSGIGQASESLTSISVLTNSLSKLGNKGVTNAITNIPKLASAMKDLFTTLSKAPRVSDNVLSMTKALANLASQGQKTSSATKGIVNAFKSSGNIMSGHAGIISRLGSAIGTFYANFTWLIRAVSGIKSAVKSSMDYVETLNYFDAAFGQVAERAVKNWKKAGYDSAKEYYDSFSARAKQVTKQMTGWEISKSGALDYAGTTNLGIDPNKLMNYQATFGQMSSSMGVASEYSLKLSETMTKLGADLASVKNMDFDAVWKNMASGLVGMSRTMDKYGVNIRLVNLQQELSNIGINANIQNLNQQEKALLRTIIMLKSTKYAWGDLADTISQPANQVRLLKANFQNLSRTIGNLFLPIVARILPYINGLAIALQRLFTWIGKSLGIDVSKITSSVGDSEFDMSELADDTEDVASGLDDANDKAKKLKKTTSTIGIDKLNIISKDKDNSGADKSSGAKGLGVGDMKKLQDAFDKWYKKYLKKWNEAFKDVENNAQKIADKIVDTFKNGKFYEAGKFIGEKITNGLNSIPWDKVYEGSRNFGKGFAEFLNGLISPELFAAVGKTIAGALNTAIQNQLGFTSTFDFANLGDSIGEGITKFFETFDFKGLATVLNNWANGILTAVVHAIGNINWLSVFKSAFDFFSTLEPSSVAILLLAKRFNALRKSMGLFKATGFVFKGTLQGITSGIKGIASSIKTNGFRGSFKNFGTDLRNIGNQLTGMQKAAIGAISIWAEWKTVSSTVKGLKRGTQDLATGIIKIGTVSAIAATAMYTAFGPYGVAVVAITGLAAAISGIADAESERIKQIKEDAKKAKDEAVSDLKEYENSVKSAQDESVVQDKEVDKAKEYWGELQKIVDENGNIKQGYKDRAENLVKYINETLGTEYEIVDGQIDKYKELEKQIDNVIEKKKLNVALDTYKSQRDDAEKKKNNTADKILEEEKNVNYWEAKLKRTQDKSKKIQNSQTASMQKKASWLGKVKYVEKVLEDRKSALAAYKKEFALQTATIEEYDAMERDIIMGNTKSAKKHKFNLDYGILLSKNSSLNAVQQQTVYLKDEWDKAKKRYKEGLASAEDVKNAKKAYIKQLKELLKFDINDIFDDSNGPDSWGAKIKNMWVGLPEEIKRKFEEKYPQIATVLNYATGKIVNLNPDDAVKKDTLNGFGNKGKEIINSFISGMKSLNISNALKSIFDIDGKLELAFKPIVSFTKNIFNGLFGGDKTTKTAEYEVKTLFRSKPLEKFKLGSFATGGFPEDGLFFANHSELVGKFSNGKTAVANNAQITNGIEEAAYRGYMRALASQTSNYNNKPQKIEVPVYLDKRQIARAVNEENARSGSTMLGNEAGY